MENDIKNEFKDASASWFPKGSLVYYASTDKNNDMSDGTNYRLAYKFVVQSLDPFDNIVVYVDSETVECLGKGSLSRSANGTVATVYNGTKSFTTLYRGFPNYDYVLRDQNTASEIITRNLEFNFLGEAKSFGSTPDIDEHDNQWAVDEDEHAASSLWAVESAYNVFFGYFGRTYGMRSYAHQIRVYNHHNYLLMFLPTELGDYIFIGNGMGNSIYDDYYNGSLDAIAHEFAHGVSTSACDLYSYDEYDYISGQSLNRFQIYSVNSWSIRRLEAMIGSVVLI